MGSAVGGGKKGVSAPGFKRFARRTPNYRGSGGGSLRSWRLFFSGFCINRGDFSPLCPSSGYAFGKADFGETDNQAIKENGYCPLWKYSKEILGGTAYGKDQKALLN